MNLEEFLKLFDVQKIECMHVGYVDSNGHKKELTLGPEYNIMLDDSRAKCELYEEFLNRNECKGEE